MSEKHVSRAVDPGVAANTAEVIRELDERGRTSRAPRSRIAVEREQRALSFVKSMLDGVAGSPLLRTGEQLQEEDKAEFVAAAMQETAGMPQRVKAELKKTVEQIVDLIGGGERAQAHEYARSESYVLGVNLGASPAWTPKQDSPEEIAAIVAGISRG